MMNGLNNGICNIQVLKNKNNLLQYGWHLIILLVINNYKY
jgi:hypothetical protein